MVNQLFGVSAPDPLTFARVAVLLNHVAVAACFIPARRAIRVDPIVALRCESGRRDEPAWFSGPRRTWLIGLDSSAPVAALRRECYDLLFYVPHRY
ncbi:MAG TPA: hypothetical protein VF749_13065, partial [Candidatus Acidoferrum sp.]